MIAGDKRIGSNGCIEVFDGHRWLNTSGMPTHKMPTYKVNSPIYDVQYKDIAMHGKLIIATTKMAEHDYQQIQHIAPIKERMRLELAEQIALGMIDNKLIETTSIMDTYSGERIIRARCYLAPDSDVRMLRTVMKDSL